MKKRRRIVPELWAPYIEKSSFRHVFRDNLCQYRYKEPFGTILCVYRGALCLLYKQKEQELLLIDSIIIIWYKLIKNVSYYSWSSFFIRKPILEVFSPYWCGYKVSRYWNILNVISVTSFVGREGLQPGNFALEGATRTD